MTAQIDELLTAAREILNECVRGEMLRALAACLSPDGVGEVLDSALEVRDGGGHAEVLGELVAWLNV